MMTRAAREKLLEHRNEICRLTATIVTAYHEVDYRLSTSDDDAATEEFCRHTSESWNAIEERVRELFAKITNPRDLGLSLVMASLETKLGVDGKPRRESERERSIRETKQLLCRVGFFAAEVSEGGCEVAR